MTTTTLSPADVHSLQRTLEHKQQLVWDRPKDTDLQVEVSKLQIEVAEAQEAIGGVVVRVPQPRIDDLRKKIEKVAKRHAKLELGENSKPPSLTDTGVRETEIYKKEERVWAYLVVSGSAPRFEGWKFVATLQHEEAGTVLRSVPGVNLDLGDYRATTPLCEHCETKRRRKDTFVVYHEDRDTMRQVGRNCLADFIGGLTPERAAKGFEYALFAIEEGRKAEANGWDGFKAEPVEDLVNYLTHAALVVRKYGWVSKSAAYQDEEKVASAGIASNNLFNYEHKRTDRQGIPLWEDPTPEDVETAKATVAYIRSDEFGGDNDYVHNMKVVFADDNFKVRNTGLVASGVFCYERNEQKLAEKKAEETAHPASPVVEGKIEVTGTVVKTDVKYNPYQDCDRPVMTVRDDRGFKVWGSIPKALVGINKGDRITFTATVEKSDKDETFGFFKRPTKAVKL